MASPLVSSLLRCQANPGDPRCQPEGSTPQQPRAPVSDPGLAQQFFGATSLRQRLRSPASIGAGIGAIALNPVMGGVGMLARGGLFGLAGLAQQSTLNQLQGRGMGPHEAASFVMSQAPQERGQTPSFSGRSPDRSSGGFASGRNASGF